MINLEWFRTFKTVYDKGSMTEAAKTLNMSQPGVSLHLRSLESHIGYKLFERMPRKLVPTERAKLLYNAIVDSLSHLLEVEKNFQKAAGRDMPTVTLGMCFEMFQTCLEKYVPTFPFNLILEFGEYPELLQKLENNIIDLVITPQKIEMRGLCYRPFSKESIILVAGQGTETDSFTELVRQGDWEKVRRWLMSRIWYGITGDNEHLRRFWQLNFGTYPNFRPNYIVPNILSIVRTLSHAPGISVVPDFLCRRQLESGVITMLWQGKRPLENTLYFAQREKSSCGQEIAHIQHILEEELAPGGRPVCGEGCDRCHGYCSGV